MKQVWSVEPSGSEVQEGWQLAVLKRCRCSKPPKRWPSGHPLELNIDYPARTIISKKPPVSLKTTITPKKNFQNNKLILETTFKTFQTP